MLSTHYDRVRVLIASCPIRSRPLYPFRPLVLWFFLARTHSCEGSCARMVMKACLPLPRPIPIMLVPLSCSSALHPRHTHTPSVPASGIRQRASGSNNSHPRPYPYLTPTSTINSTDLLPRVSHSYRHPCTDCIAVALTGNETAATHHRRLQRAGVRARGPVHPLAARRRISLRTSPWPDPFTNRILMTRAHTARDRVLLEQPRIHIPLGARTGGWTSDVDTYDAQQHCSLSRCSSSRLDLQTAICIWISPHHRRCSNQSGRRRYNPPFFIRLFTVASSSF